ncbi:MAG: hypothetical protein QW534_10235 [Candidatus Methanomethylicia archaeon]
MIIKEIPIVKSPRYSIENIKKIAILSLGVVDKEIIDEKRILIEARIFVCPTQVIIEDQDGIYDVKIQFVCITDNCNFKDLCGRIIEEKASKFKNILPPPPQKSNEDIESVIIKILRDKEKNINDILNELMKYSLNYCPDTLVQILLRMERNGKIKKKFSLGKYLWYI